MSSAVLNAESTLTDRYQTTIPRNVRDVLSLNKQDKIAYTLRSDGVVEIARAMPEKGKEEDPVMLKFLDFLGSNIVETPQIVQPLASELRNRMSSLVEGVEYDIDAPLLDDDEDN